MPINYKNFKKPGASGGVGGFGLPAPRSPIGGPVTTPSGGGFGGATPPVGGPSGGFGGISSNLSNLNEQTKIQTGLNPAPSPYNNKYASAPAPAPAQSPEITFGTPYDIGPKPIIPEDGYTGQDGNLRLSSDVYKEPVVPPVPETYQTTDIGQQAKDKFAEYALQDDPQVQVERDRLGRNNALRVEQARRLAHGRAVREGYAPGTAQYEQMMRNAVTDSENTGIQATNAFQDFARGSRSDQQQQLMGLSDSEFSKSQSDSAKGWNDFNQMVKFLPSDQAQQELMKSKLGGQDINEAFQSLYGADGTLKPENKDKTKAELIKSGIEDSVNQMRVNPETGGAWQSNEKVKYIEEFYANNFQSIVEPVGEEARTREGKISSRDDVTKALTSGDISTLSTTDWNNVTDQQVKEAKSSGLITEFDSTTNTGSPWSGGKNKSTKDAKSEWLTNNPISAAENKGKIIEKDGILYEIVDPMQVHKGSGDNKTIRVRVVPVKGGPETTLIESDWFEKTTGGTLKSWGSSLNPF